MAIGARCKTGHWGAGDTFSRSALPLTLSARAVYQAIPPAEYEPDTGFPFPEN
jgi:hypothetical protein